MKAVLYIEVEFDENVTDADSVAVAADRLLETALSTPDVLDDYGNPTFGAFYELNWEAIDRLQSESVCKFCGKRIPMGEAYYHQGAFVGQCCWDERLRTTE
jgi:hypothetical protein